MKGRIVMVNKEGISGRAKVVTLILAEFLLKLLKKEPYKDNKSIAKWKKFM